jgi:hypothetical protein
MTRLNHYCPLLSFRTYTTKIVPLPQTMWETMEEEVREMMTMWPDIIRDVTEHVKNIPDVDKWLEKVSHY